MLASDSAIPTADQILAARPRKNHVDFRRPYAFLVEPEHTAEGRVEDVATVFLTNRECPYRCLMCDLWKNTTSVTVPRGAIPAQIDFALGQLPPATHIKLYNSGNFFDRRAIPPTDHAAIAARVSGFRSVIVENHPRLCGPHCLSFRDRIPGTLEIALGLETIHPQVLPRLNKSMTADDFRRAAGFLREAGIRVRAFILLRPPWLGEQAGLEWALRSTEFAFDAGAECCVIIPTRGGNGILEKLAAEGLFHPPRIESLEAVLAEALALGRGRVFVDLWNFDKLADCTACAVNRRERLEQMNLTQRSLPPVPCHCRP